MYFKKKYKLKIKKKKNDYRERYIKKENIRVTQK